jgi:hypothetical protein
MKRRRRKRKKRKKRKRRRGLKREHMKRILCSSSERVLGAWVQSPLCVCVVCVKSQEDTLVLGITMIQWIWIHSKFTQVSTFQVLSCIPTS